MTEQTICNPVRLAANLSINDAAIAIRVLILTSVRPNLWERCRNEGRLESDYSALIIARFDSVTVGVVTTLFFGAAIFELGHIRFRPAEYPCYRIFRVSDVCVLYALVYNIYKASSYF